LVRSIGWKSPKLSVAALTPIMTGILNILVVRMGTKLDVIKQVKRRLSRPDADLRERDEAAVTGPAASARKDSPMACRKEQFRA
jgi:hypothetical protein